MVPRSVLIILGVALVLTLGVAVFLQPGEQPKLQLPLAAIDATEHGRTINLMRPPKRERPVIAIVANNEATEVTDLMVPYGVLGRAGVAEVLVVAETDAPIHIFPISRLGSGEELFTIDPQLTFAAFYARYPEGADYVIVPAILPRDDRAVLGWIRDQRSAGATIISVCAGAMTLAAAGLLDGRHATTHWSYVEELRGSHPTLVWAPDRRFVAQEGIVTTTGISASVPVAVTLVESIAGRERAEQLAADLGVDNWDARHRSSAFQLTWERRKAFLRNWVSFWRRETIGLPICEGVDEIALALMADVYSRTALTRVNAILDGGDAGARTMHGLVIRLIPKVSAAEVDRMAPSLQSVTPALTLERVLPQIASTYGAWTADLVALQMEYSWPS
jgi:putative intracellular protease/amidase